MLQEGLSVLVIGMGTVIAFLILLVFCMQAMSAVVARIAPHAGLEPVEPGHETAAHPAAEVVAVAIAAAHRSRRRG